MIRGATIMMILCWMAFATEGQNLSFSRCDSLLQNLTVPQLTGDLLESTILSSVSPFFSEEWLKGKVELTNGLTVKDQHFKYNGLLDRLIWINDDFVRIRLDKDPIRSFYLYDKLIPGKFYYFEKIRVREEYIPDSAWVFAQLLFKKDLSLYVLRKVIRSGTEERKTDRIVIDAYEKKNIYFFRKGEQISSGFSKISKKNLLSTFPGVEEELSQQMRLARQNRIKTEEDLVSFTEWLNGKPELWKK